MNFRNHAKKQHQITIPTVQGIECRMKDAEEELQSLISQVKSLGLDTKVLYESLDQKVIETALLDLIIVRNLSFYLIKMKEFQTFIHSLNQEALKLIPLNYYMLVN